MHRLADCAAAIRSLLLAAHSMGLDAVWQKLYPYHQQVAEVRKLLGIPHTAYPMAVLAVGRSTKRQAPAVRYDPAKAKRNHCSSSQMKHPSWFPSRLP